MRGETPHSAPSFPPSVSPLLSPPAMDEKTPDTKTPPRDEEVFNEATRPLLDLSLVHQKAIPGFWNQIRFTTFPVNWLVVGHLPSDRRKMVIQGEGPGGLRDAVRKLRDDEIQYAGFRVSVDGKEEGSDDSADDVDDLEGEDAHALDVFVLLRWVGKHTTAQQRSRLEDEMAFMKEYFYDHHIDIYTADFEVPAGGDEEQRIAALEQHFKAQIMQRATARNSEALRFDFGNESAVGVCTHYDVLEEGETEEQVNSALTHDALFAAMHALQEAGEGVEHYEEAKQRTEDHISAGGMAVHGGASVATTAVAVAAPVAPAPRLPVPPAHVGGETKAAPGQVEVPEVEHLIQERVRVEEERFELHRAIQGVELMERQQKQRMRTQERLAERRKRRAAKATGDAEKTAMAAVAPESPDRAAVNFQARIAARGLSSAERTAARVAARKTRTAAERVAAAERRAFMLRAREERVAASLAATRADLEAMHGAGGAEKGAEFEFVE